MTNKPQKVKTNNCYECKHRRTLFYSAHSGCAKPDPNMVGVEYGIKNGWFNYPSNFDPVWVDVVCANFEKLGEALND